MNKNIIVMSIIGIIFGIILFLGNSQTNVKFNLEFENGINYTNSTVDFVIGSISFENTGILPIQPNLPQFIGCSNSRVYYIFYQEEDGYSRNTYLSPKESKTFDMIMNIYSQYDFKGKVITNETVIDIYETEYDYQSCYDTDSEPTYSLIIQND